MAIEAKRNGLLIDGELRPFWSGSIQYFRTEASLWPRLLDLVKEMGFGFIETYIPWSVHELEKGKFDFGEKSPNKDLDQFLALCQERGFKVMARPGPHINAELTCFGYPRRMLERRECLSRSVDDDLVWLPVAAKMFPAPSYASEAFYEEVQAWYSAAAKVLKPRLHPKGPVVAVQVDNEFCNMFRTSPYDHDYHPDAVRLWHRFILEKYREIAELNRSYHTTYSSFEHVPPARGFEAKEQKDLPFYLDWVEFREFYMQSALSRLKEMLEDAGIRGVLFTHNYPFAGDMPPNNYSELEKFLDFQGPDMYPVKTQYPLVKKLARFASGLSRYPVIPEFSSGGWLFIPVPLVPISLDDQKFTTASILMHGIKGVNFYMIVERERWYGSPVSRNGRVRIGYFEFYQNLNSLVKQSGILKMEKYAPCLMLASRDYERLEAAATILDPLPIISPDLFPPELHAAEDSFGFKRPIQLCYRNFQETIYSALDQAGIGLALGSTSQALSSLKHYQMAAVASFEFMSGEVQEKLRDYVESGGFLIAGPELPVQDERGECCTYLRERLVEKEKIKGEIPCTVFELGKGRLVLIEECFEFKDKKNPPAALVSLMEKLAKMAGAEIKFKSLTEPVETALHFGGGKEILFVANPSPEAKAAKISLPCPCRLKDLESGEEFSGDTTVTIDMPAWKVRIMEVTK